MPRTNFHLFSTAGNTTLFVDAPDAARAGLNVIPCEQAGCADVGAGLARMAADEFCVNACLAFAALRKLAGMEPGLLSMAGITAELNAMGKCPNWQAGAILPFGNCEVEEFDGVKIARLPGISHALLAVEAFPDAETARTAGETLLTELRLRQEAAAGIVWHMRKGARRHAIMPLVNVPLVGTCNFEQACGSASIALARALGPGEYEIEQPSGVVAAVRNHGQNMEITAPVQLLAQGELWLP